MSEPTRSKEDAEELVKAFSELGQIANADTPEELVQLMAKLSYTVKRILHLHTQTVQLHTGLLNLLRSSIQLNFLWFLVMDLSADH